MKNADYWRKRAEAVEEQAHQSAAAFLETATEEFDKASARLQREIADWYRRFAEDNEISLVEAKRLLTGRELKEFRWTVEDYINAARSIDPDSLDKALLKQLENASARVHISRLEALQMQLQAESELLYGNQIDKLTQHLTSTYEDGYYRTAFTIQQGIGVGWSFARLADDAIKKVLSEPWTADNNTFRDKCWTQKKQLSEALRTQLTQGIIRGDNPMQMADVIAKQFNVSKNKAARLCYTESAHISALSQRECYKELQVEQFQIVETLDSSTCPTCGNLDGKVLPMSRYEVGVTAPPFHPHCRGCTCPYFADDVGQRVARDAVTDETFYVPSDMTYREWKVIQDGKYGAGTVDLQRKMRYNELKDSDQYVAYRERLGNNAPKSFAAFQKLKYSDDWNEFKAYARSIESRELSALADFTLYQDTSKQIDEVLVGKVTKNGLTITGKSNHYIARTIGSVEQRRSGVDVTDALQTLVDPVKIDPVISNPNGKSQRIIGNKSAVTVNPDTGKLIQVNPIKTKNRGR